MEKLRYIKNYYPDFKSEEDIYSLLTSVFKILLKDIKKFQKTINSQQSEVVCSKPSKSYNSFNCFDGAGSYLICYMNLLRFSQKLKFITKSSEDNKYIKYIINYCIEQKIDYTNIFNEDYFLKSAMLSYQTLQKLTENYLSANKKPQISFYFGPSSIFLQGLDLAYLNQDNSQFKFALQNIRECFQKIKNGHNQYYQEILYGISGYLYCLIYTHKKYSQDNIEINYRLDLRPEIMHLIKQIYNEGVQNYLNLNKNNTIEDQRFRLVYYFHEKEYLGGAHGLAGILYQLLCSYEIIETELYIKEQQFCNVFVNGIIKSLNFLLQVQTESGNYPSSNKTNISDHLVQFCHGAPGIIQALLKAHSIFINNTTYRQYVSEAQQYIDSALLAGEHIWKYGILKKGFGLCHGISGNGYSLLSIYKTTNNTKWLYRALVFGSIKNNKNIMDIIESFDFENRYKIGISDYPYSLMLGLTGDICFMLDLFDPLNSYFPGYEH